MSRCKLLGLGSVAVLLCCLVAVQADDRYTGYTITKAVNSYLNMSMDYTDIVVAAGRDWQTAMTIYKVGKNGKTTTGTRNFKEWATDKNTGETYFDAFEFYAKLDGSNYDYLDTMMNMAFDKGIPNMVPGVLHAITIKNIMHKVDATSKLLEDATEEDDDVVSTNIDQAFAMCFSNKGSLALSSIMSRAYDLAVQMGTKGPLGPPDSSLRRVMASLFSDLKFWAQEWFNPDSQYTEDGCVDAFNLRAQQLRDTVAGYLLQSVWRDAYCVVLATACKDNYLASSCKLSAATTMPVLGPLLFRFKEDFSDKTILGNNTLLWSGISNDNYTQVKTAVGYLSTKLGYGPLALGLPQPNAMKGLSSTVFWCNSTVTVLP